MDSKNGKKSWLLNVLVFFAAVFIIFVITLLHNQNERRRRPGYRCISNLKQIGLGLKQYALDYNDFFPAEDNSKGLDKLRETEYLTDYGCYVCPGSGMARGLSGPITEDSCSYIYFGGFKERDGDYIPLAFDKPGNHADYVNVLYLDGHAKKYSIEAGNCEEIIIFLNKEHKYPAKLYKQLLEKAKEIDTRLSE